MGKYKLKIGNIPVVYRCRILLLNLVTTDIMRASKGSCTLAIFHGENVSDIALLTCLGYLGRHNTDRFISICVTSHKVAKASHWQFRFKSLAMEIRLKCDFYQEKFNRILKSYLKILVYPYPKNYCGQKISYFFNTLVRTPN